MPFDNPRPSKRPRKPKVIDYEDIKARTPAYSSARGDSRDERKKWSESPRDIKRDDQHKVQFTKMTVSPAAAASPKPKPRKVDSKQGKPKKAVSESSDSDKILSTQGSKEAAIGKRDTLIRSDPKYSTITSGPTRVRGKATVKATPARVTPSLGTPRSQAVTPTPISKPKETAVTDKQNIWCRQSLDKTKKVKSDGLDGNPLRYKKGEFLAIRNEHSKYCRNSKVFVVD